MPFPTMFSNARTSRTALIRFLASIRCPPCNSSAYRLWPQSIAESRIRLFNAFMLVSVDGKYIRDKRPVHGARVELKYFDRKTLYGRKTVATNFLELVQLGCGGLRRGESAAESQPHTPPGRRGLLREARRY